MTSPTLTDAKRRVVETLKRRGTLSATEIASALGLTDVAIRQHLETLAKAESEDGIPAALHELRSLSRRLVVPGGDAPPVGPGAAPAPSARSTAGLTESAQDDDSPIVSRLASGGPRIRATIAKFAGRLDEKLDEMDAAWQARDFGELASLAHWLKGSGGTVGFDAFTEPAKHLEGLAKAETEDRKNRRLEEAQHDRDAARTGIHDRYRLVTLLLAAVPGILLGLFTYRRRSSRASSIIPSNRLVGGSN